MLDALLQLRPTHNPRNAMWALTHNRILRDRELLSVGKPVPAWDDSEIIASAKAMNYPPRGSEKYPIHRPAHTEADAADSIDLSVDDAPTRPANRLPATSPNLQTVKNVPFHAKRCESPTADQIAFLARWGSNPSWKPKNFTEAENVIEKMMAGKRFKKRLAAQLGQPPAPRLSQ